MAGAIVPRGSDEFTPASCDDVFDESALQAR
jgi:hypothetical protein